MKLTTLLLLALLSFVMTVRFRKRKMLGQFKKKTQTVGSNSICLVSKAWGEHRILLLTKGRKKTPLFWELQKAAHGLKPIQVSGLKSYPGQWHCLSKGIQKHCCFEHLKIKLRKEKEHQFRNSSTSECG